MSKSELKPVDGKWLAIYGNKEKMCDTMKEAAQWLDDCADAERQKKSQGN